MIKGKPAALEIERRYETKFRITDLDLYEVQHLIKTHPAVFQEVYYQRNVNNIYFDSSGLKSFVDNVEGETNRRKVRIRWYGDLFGLCEEPKLEIKYKSGLLGWKEKHHLKAFKLSKDVFFPYKDVISELTSKKDFNVLKLHLDALQPALLNRYKRSYYLSYDKKFRVTVDTEMEFYSINPVREFFKTFSDERQTIMELKYDQEHFESAKNITQSFPFRVTKNSKYVVGIERVRHW